MIAPAYYMILLFVVISSVYFYGIYRYLRRCYITIAPNKAAIIYGRRHEYLNPLTGKVQVRGFRVVSGGSALLVRGVEEVMYIDLNNQKVELEISRIQGLNKIAVNVKATMVFGFNTDEAALIKTATSVTDNKEKSETNHIIIEKTLEGHFCNTISEINITDLQQNKKEVYSTVEKSMNSFLEKMGMKVIDFTIWKFVKHGE